MRFASILHQGRPHAVLIDGADAIPLVGIAELGLATPSSVLRDPPLDRAASVPLDAVQLRPVIPQPRRVICVGLNYRAHVAESGREEPEYPVLFTKFASSLAGPYDAIPCPPESSAVDYEGELLVVIGQAGRRVPEDRALELVAGYAVADDITMRDYQNRTHQWLQGKAWDASTPVGPHLVSADEVGDPAALSVRTTLNGQVVQDAPTARMIFSVPTLVSVISQFTGLEPGDLILTGTPEGVGFRREPPLLLHDGDVVAVEVDGVGRLENRMTAG